MSATPLRRVRDEPVTAFDGDGILAQLAALAVLDGNLTHTYAPRWCWPEVDGIAGKFLPGTLNLLASQPGGGKTTIVTNLSRAWSDVGIRHTIAPLETPGERFLRAWAAIGLGYKVAHVLRNDWAKLPDGAKQTINDEIGRLLEPPWAGTLIVRPEETMTRNQCIRSIEEAAAAGSQAYILDHLHEIAEHEDGPELTRQVSLTMRALKSVAKRCYIALLVLLQQNRSDQRDRLAPYRQPDLRALKGGGSIEASAETCLFAWRPLNPALTRKDYAAFHAGQRELADMWELHRIAIGCGKNRIDGDAVGRVVKLQVKRGVITSLGADETSPPVPHPPAADLFGDRT